MHTETLTIRHACGHHAETRLPCTGPLTARELDQVGRVLGKQLCTRCDRKCRKLLEGDRR